MKNENPSFSILKLLPATILALTVTLSAQDCDVLAYLITRSIATNFDDEQNERNCKKTKKGSIFECGCFDCYTGFWVKWDLSPNREVIHQIIEGFEDYLLKSSKTQVSTNSKQKNRMKRRNMSLGHRRRRRRDMVMGVLENEVFTADDVEIMVSNEITQIEVEVEEEIVVIKQTETETEYDEIIVLENVEMAAAVTAVVATVQYPMRNHHKGLASKVLPDLGFLPVEASVFEVEIWGLGGTASKQTQNSYQQRHQLFTEQRRKIDSNTFTNWEDSPEKMMMDIVSNSNKVQRENH